MNLSTFFLPLLTTLTFAVPAQAQTMTHIQTRQCTPVPAQSAQHAGFIQVGNQTQQIYTEAISAHMDCEWVDQIRVTPTYR